MKRTTPLLALAAVATLALAACQDSAPTGVRPDAAPLAAKGGNGDKNPAAVLPTNPGGILPKVVDGNTAGDGAAECSTYGGATAVRVDGDYDQTVAGYAFHVDGGTTLSFNQTSPGYAITAVLVKGGPDHDAYDYGARNSGTTLGVTADGGLTSPAVGNGKSIPDISHYVVCYVRNIHVTKALVGVKASDGHGGMMGDASWSKGGPVVIPQGETRWLEYDITYEQPAGSTGTLTEVLPEICSSAGFRCDFSGLDARTLKAAVTGSGTRRVLLDVTNNGCGGGTLTNKVMFDVGNLWTDASASDFVAGLCKSLRAVYTTGMTPVDGWQQTGMVDVPRDGTRWLRYEITYTLPAGVRATLRDPIPEACAGNGIACSSAGLNDGGAFLTIVGSGSPQSVGITVDVHNKVACGDRPYTNTVSLVRDGGPATNTSSQPITIWASGPECPHV